MLPDVAGWHTVEVQAKHIVWTDSWYSGAIIIARFLQCYYILRSFSFLNGISNHHIDRTWIGTLSPIKVEVEDLLQMPSCLSAT